jgi:hypothetical protein
MTRLILRAIDVGASIIFMALCAKASAFTSTMICGGQAPPCLSATAVDPPATYAQGKALQ